MQNVSRYKKKRWKKWCKHPRKNTHGDTIKNSEKKITSRKPKDEKLIIRGSPRLDKKISQRTQLSPNQINQSAYHLNYQDYVKET